MFTVESTDTSTESPPRDARRAAWAGFWALRVLAVPVVVGALIWPLLMAGSVDAVQAGRIALVIAVQALGGALLWRLARGPVPAYFAELIGMGLALGSLLSLLAQQVFRVTPLSAQAWWLPAGVAVVLSAVLIAVPATRRRLALGQDAPFTLDEAGGVGLGVLIGLVFVWTFWRAHPLAWSGWWAYYLDIPYHEALAHSVTTWGPWDNILAVGSPVRYHWFAHAWAGTTTNASAAGPFVVMTRALPLVVVLGTVCLVWAWARRLSDSRSVPLLAVLLTTVATNVGSAKPIDFVHLLAISPSLGMGALWLLAAALVFTEHVRRRLRWSLPLLALLAVGCVGGKSSNGPALLGGIGLAALVALLQPRVRKRVWSAFAVALVAVGAAYVVLLSGSAGNLSIEPGATARVLGVLPDSTWVGILGGTVASVLVLATKWMGVSVLASDRRSWPLPDLWFAVGAALSGILLMVVLGHPGASQLYFPLSSGLVVTVVSAWGIGEAFRLVSSAQGIAAVVVGVLAGGISAAVGGAALAAGSGRLTILPARFAGAGPYAVWLLPLVLVLAVAVRARTGGVRVRREGLVGVVCLSLVTASLVAGAVVLGDMARAARPAPAAPNAGPAWTQAHLSALLWLRDHSAQQDVIATNRQCTAPEIPGRPCGSTERWFLTAALTGRRMYVEGADYAISQPHPAWIDRRVALSRRFVDTPGAADAGVLWAAGVRWVVVDLASTTTRNWAPYAQPVETTATTEVLRLAQP